VAVYDLEEQEKLDDLKAWWARWGTTVTGVLAAVCVAVVAIQGYRWWNARQVEEASLLYGAVSQAVRANDVAKARDAVTQLEEKFGRTGYAPRAALVVAKLQFDAGDTKAARTQLEWVIEHADEVELKEIARYRLAELLLHDQQFDAALTILDAKHGDAFAGLYADLRGDALSAANRANEAREAYKTAIGKLDPKSPYRNYVQVKMDSLPSAAATSAGGTAGAAPAAAARTAPATAPAVAPPMPPAPAAATSAQPAPATSAPPTPAPKQ
jgi:predicted negative regulator of RcsB-dependent stress response